MSDVDAEMRFSKRERQVRNMPDYDKIIESRGAFHEDSLSPELLQAYLDVKLTGEDLLGGERFPESGRGRGQELVYSVGEWALLM